MLKIAGAYAQLLRITALFSVYSTSEYGSYTPLWLNSAHVLLIKAMKTVNAVVPSWRNLFFGSRCCVLHLLLIFVAARLVQSLQLRINLVYRVSYGKLDDPSPGDHIYEQPPNSGNRVLA